MSAIKKRLADAASMGPEYAESVRRYLAENGRKGGQKSRRKLTKKQAREMVKARERKRAAGVALKALSTEKETNDPKLSDGGHE